MKRRPAAFHVLRQISRRPLICATDIARYCVSSLPNGMIETETCDCLLGEFTWDMALAELPRFQTSDNPRLPFNVLDLYAMADALEAEHAEGCSE